MRVLGALSPVRLVEFADRVELVFIKERDSHYIVYIEEENLPQTTFILLYSYGFLYH